MADITTHSTAATGSDDHQQLLPHISNGSSFQYDGPGDQNQTIRMEVDVEEGERSQTHSEATAVPGEVAEEQHNAATLRAEIRRLQSDAEAEQRALDDMLMELTSAQDELHDVRIRLAAKESECADLRTRISTTPPQEPLHSPNQSAVVAEMQDRINSLTLALGAKDELLRAHDAELAAERAQTQVQAQKADVLSQDAAEVSNQRRTIEELKEHVRFFKANSEQLGKEIRGLKGENLRLGEDLDVKQRELDNERSTILALKMEAGSA